MRVAATLSAGSENRTPVRAHIDGEWHRRLLRPVWEQLQPPGVRDLRDRRDV